MRIIKMRKKRKMVMTILRILQYKLILANKNRKCRRKSYKRENS